MKVLILVNRDFVLYNFRAELVERLIREGHKVYICLPHGNKVDYMIQMGCIHIPVEIDKRGTSIHNDMKLLRDYHTIFRKLHPDILLAYTTKCDIYGGIVARYMRIPYLINVSGLGTALEQGGVLQKLTMRMYKSAVHGARCVFFQNAENREFFRRHRLYGGPQRLIPGSGVNLERWYPMEYPDDRKGIVFLFIARVIKEKGIEEYLAAAKQITSEYPGTIFRILGPCDGEYQDMLEEYQKRGIIKYHGMVQDTAPYLRDAHCTIHPSYYPEGISNVLLESAACARPVITTDRSGCRETVDAGVTGFVFRQRDQKQLVACIRKFLGLENAQRRAMGLAGRAKMEREFDRSIVVDAYMDEIGKLYVGR